MQFRPGDILACYGEGWQSKTIRWATWGPSHVGIIAPISSAMKPDPSTKRYKQDDLVLFESTTLCPRPCLITGNRWSGVQAQPIWDRIEDYSGDVQLIRLTPSWELSTDEAQFLSHILTEHFIGLRYDMEEAIISGTRVLKWSHFLPYPNGSLFCSELVAFCMMRLCRMSHNNPSLYNPASLIRRLRREGKVEKPRWVDNRPVETEAA